MDNFQILENRTSKRKRIYSHLNRINKEFITGEVLAPITLEVFPTNYCNSNCYFCAYPKVNFDQLSDRIFESLIDSCIHMGVKGVTFSGGGEPTMHKYLPRAIKKLTDTGISVGLITNGVYISEELYKVINKCSWIRFSLLTSDAKEYYSFTNLGEQIYSQVLKNIKRVTDNKGNSIIGATMMVNDQNLNLNAIVSFLKLAGRLGMDQIFFTEMVDSIGEFKMKKEHMLQYTKTIHLLSEKNRVVTNIDKFLSKENIVMSRQGGSSCGIIEKNLINVITADGNVYPCLGKYTIGHEQPLGSLYELPFESIVSKSNIESKTSQYLIKTCKFCKNSTTRKELTDYFETGILGYVNDPHNNFL